LGIPPPRYRGKRFATKNGIILKENVSCKKVSGRTVQLDEINSIFVIRSKERNLGSDSGVSYCD
jgi:predicted methyltransferase